MAPHVLRRLEVGLATLVCSCSAAVRVDAPPLVAHAPRALPIDVEHYALEVELRPAARSIRAECRVRFFARSTALDSIELDLADAHVERVVDVTGKTLAFVHDAATLRVQLASALQLGDSAEIAVRYSSIPRAGLWFAGDAGGLPSHVFTQGQCEDSRRWFPCVDEPSERATSELCVRMPGKWTSLAAGELVESSLETDGRRRERWSMTVPHPAYLTTLVAGELWSTRERFDGTELVYAHAGGAQLFTQGTFERTPEVLQFLTELSGQRYPYAKYAQVCVENSPMGGMENVSATTLTDACSADLMHARDGATLDLIVHEAAHQWFGNLVTCADWSHVWLNEGFATYCEMLFREATGDREDFLIAVRDMQEAYTASDRGAFRRPHVWNVYREPFDLFVRGGHAYPGAASRLHYLRFVVGDAAFARGLKLYLAEHRGRAVTTADFQRSMERASGLDLEQFFEQWLFSAGFPEFELRHAWDAERRVVRVRSSQVQSAHAGTAAVFTGPVDLTMSVAGVVERRRVLVEAREQTFELASPAAPDWLVFDDGGWMPKSMRHERGDDEWIALATREDEPNCRRDALVELGVRLAQSRDQALRLRVASVMLERLSDRCAGVRAAAARALSSTHFAYEHELACALRERATTDPAVSVRVAALRCLAGWPADQRWAEFARRAFEQRFSWATMGAAAELYVAAAHLESANWLRQQLSAVASPRDLLAGHLCGAALRLPAPEARRVLAEILFDERRHDDTRDVAARALAALERGSSSFTPDACALLARTRSYRLQGGLIELLGRIADARAAAALRAFYVRCLDPRHRRSIEDALERIDA